MNNNVKTKKKLICEKIIVAKSKTFVFKKMMTFKIMSTPKKTYDDKKKNHCQKKFLLKNGRRSANCFQKKICIQT